MKAKTTGSIAVIACAVLGVLAVALFRATPIELAYPVEKARVSWAHKIAARWHGLWHGVEASAENVRLKREVDCLAIDRNEFVRLASENARLRQVLGYAEGGSGKWVAAEVLSYGGGAAGVSKTIRVGKGSLDGVRAGAVVTVPEGLVGKVVSVTPHTAEVMMLTDPAVQVACLVQGEQPVRGILTGGSDERLVLRHLKAGVPIAPQSKVLTSGLGGVFPAGIEVGTFISEGNERDAEGRDAGELERDGSVRPAVDLSLLEDVFISL